MIRFLADLEPAVTNQSHMTWEVHLPPPIPLWLVVLLTLGIAILVIGLYLAQRKLASTAVLLTLLALRLGALFLILLMLFRPSWVWVSVNRSPGTLWLVMDQSGSMGLRDPQSSQLEKLRWADALGLLPESKRRSKPDVLYARSYALMRILPALHLATPYDSAVGATDTDRAEVQAFVEQMQDYSNRLHALADDIAADSQVNSQSSLAGMTRDNARIVDDGITASRDDKNLRAALLRFRWSDLQNGLQRVAVQMLTLSDRLDKEYLAAHAGDSDVQTALSRVTGQSRAELVTQLFTSEERRKGPMTELLGDFRTRIVSFADAPQNAGEVDAANRDQVIRASLVPGGKSTNLASALQFVGEQLSPEEKASVLLVTDSRQNVPGEPSEAARLLARRGVHVFGLLIGSQEIAADAAVDQVDAPDWIFKDDTLQVSATIRMDGLAGKQAAVDLYRGDVKIDTQVVAPLTNKETPRIHFTDKPGEPGVYDYEVRVAEVPGEVNTQNNHQGFRVAVKKDKLAALIVEDAPRWEYQYLANFLARDQRMKLQTVLFSPERIEGVAPPPPVQASPTNPKQDAQILPQTREEWQAFDLIVLGDVAPEKLSAVQQQYIATTVRDRGATLIVIAGQRAMPARYSDSPLAEILPVKMSSDWSAEALRHHLTDGFRPGIAPQGVDTVLTQLGSDPSSSAQAWSAMPSWFWHSELTHAKDAASVIWTLTDPLDNNPEEGTLEGARKRALLSSITIGRGRVLYLASDQTWRLRQIQGDNLQERFWGQVVRWAAGTSLPAGGRYVRFGAEPQHAEQGTPITVTARIFHEDLTPYDGAVFEAVASMKGGKVVDRVTMKGAPGDPGTYRGTFAGLPPGDLEITVTGGEVQRLLDIDPTVMLRSVGIQIEPQLNLEQRNVDTDPKLLESIANAGGGVSLNGPYADVLATMIPRNPIVRVTTETVGVFADPKTKFSFSLFGHTYQLAITYWIHVLLLVFFVLILTIEWGIRKRAGMV